MTKAELVEEVSRVSDLTKKHSEVIVDTVFKSIVDALHRGEKIELRGFGSFRLRRREPRKGRNPKTGDKVDVPPKKVPYFKPGKELKDLINKRPSRRPEPAVDDDADARVRSISVSHGPPLDALETGLRDRRQHAAPPGCIFCDALARRRRRAARRRIAAQRAFVILNKFPYNNGHLMVVPQRHVGRLADLDADELAEIMALTQAAERVLDARLPAARLQHGPEPRQAGGRRRRSITCTCTSCRAGTATRTSCRWSARRACCRKSCRRRRRRLRAAFDGAAPIDRRSWISRSRPSRTTFLERVRAFARDRGRAARRRDRRDRRRSRATLVARGRARWA